MLKKNQALFYLNVLACISCIALCIKFILMPIAAKILYAEKYKTLMFQCDNVMRDHMIAKNRVKFEKSNESIKDLESAEIGLVSCHYYDKLRKKMLIYGLTEDDLANIGLEAIEKNSNDLKKYVEYHEFKY